MKTLIIALNSKYIHSALAPWYLKASCGTECGDVRVLERTVNENAGDVLEAIYSYKPDVTAFSCYIWNISMALGIASDLKKLLPQSVIVLGGPEVSYDSVDILREHEFIDFVIAGEGEKSFSQLLSCLAKRKGLGKEPDCAAVRRGNTLTGGIASDRMNASVGRSSHTDGLSAIDGLAYRLDSGRIALSPPAFITELDSIPSPYTPEMLSSLKNKIAYFEASRGCPFSCSYCLSSASEGVRTFSAERIFSDLEKLVGSGVTQIKFVDRTFNANRDMARLIMRHIIEHYGSHSCNFHFEVGADLFDEETLAILENAPKGLFQIEAGVQSTNEKALAAVCRKTDTVKLLNNIKRLKSAGNVHIHTDLIAGLPYEDYSSFARSFDNVYSSGSHQLQLGFLKFLKGTRLRAEADETGAGEASSSICKDAAFGYKYRNAPPYEILSGRFLNFEELSILKGIAGLVDKYYNSGRFVYSLDYLINKGFRSSFAFYESFLLFLRERSLLYKPAALREYYSLLDSFASGCLDESGTGIFRELLRLDFLASDNTGTLPEFFESRGSSEFRDRCFEFLRESEKIGGIIPEAAGLTPKQLMKRVHFERFKLRISGNGIFEPVPEAYTVFLFDYISRDRVTGRYHFYAANISLS